MILTSVNNYVMQNLSFYSVYTDQWSLRIPDEASYADKFQSSSMSPRKESRILLMSTQTLEYKTIPRKRRLLT